MMESPQTHICKQRQHYSCRQWYSWRACRALTAVGSECWGPPGTWFLPRGATICGSRGGPADLCYTTCCRPDHGQCWEETIEKDTTTLSWSLAPSPLHSLTQAAHSFWLHTLVFNTVHCSFYFYTVYTKITWNSQYTAHCYQSHRMMVISADSKKLIKRKPVVGRLHIPSWIRGNSSEVTWFSLKLP